MTNSEIIKELKAGKIREVERLCIEKDCIEMIDTLTAKINNFTQIKELNVELDINFELENLINTLEFQKTKKTKELTAKNIQLLQDSDYKIIKYIEGIYTDDEFAAIKQERQAIREKITATKTAIAKCKTIEKVKKAN